MPRRNTPETTASAASAPMKLDVTITATRNYHDSAERARATVTLNDCFAVKGVRVLRGENGLFVSMPARRGQDGQYREMCHPITADFSRQLSASVLEEYQAYLSRQMEESQSLPHVIEPQQDGLTPEPEAEEIADQPVMGM